MQDHRSTHLLFQNLCCLNRNFDLISIWNWIGLCIFVKFLIIFCQSLTQADSNYLPLVVHVCMFLLNDFVFLFSFPTFRYAHVWNMPLPRWILLGYVWTMSKSHQATSFQATSLWVWILKETIWQFFVHPIRGALYHSF